MKRYVTALLVLLVLAGATWSVAAPQGVSVASPKPTAIAGKWVVINTKRGEALDATEARVGEIGQRAFLLIRKTHPASGARYHQWLPLDEIASLAVYDLESQAKRHREQQRNPAGGADFERGQQESVDGSSPLGSED